MASAARRWKYDVFLSFQGRETGKGFTYELRRRLKRRGIETFMDDPTIQVGDVISSTLLAAIEGSRFAIIILSPTYASSTLCLQELTKISQCMKSKHRILPLFFDLTFLKRCFEEAFTNYENSGIYKSEKLQEWKQALITVANFSGCDLKDCKSERELIKKAVEEFENNRLVKPIEKNRGDIEEFEPTEEAMNKAFVVSRDNVNQGNKRVRHKVIVNGNINNSGPSGNIIGGDRGGDGGDRGGDGGDSYNGGFAGPGGPAKGNNTFYYGRK